MRKSICVVAAAVTLVAGTALPAAGLPGHRPGQKQGRQAPARIPAGGPRAGARAAAPGTGPAGPAAPASAASAAPGLSRRAARPRPGGGGARRLASVPAGAAFNPVTGNSGFTVFVAGNATLNASAIGGPVALGGNLTLGSGTTFNVASQTAGSFTAAGDSRPTGLLVNGNVNWAAGASNASAIVGSNGYVKVGDMTGSAVAQSGTAPTHVVRSGQGYSSLPQIADTVFQPAASVNQAGLIGFSAAFTAFRTNSASLGACTATLVLTDANGTPLPPVLPPSTNAYITLTPGVQNVLDITSANLAHISIWQFRNHPGSTTPLIINVDTTGAGNTFTWTPPNFNQVSGGDGAYILWNFPTATTLTLSGFSTIPGTVYAPGSAVVETDGNGLNGGVIAAAYAQGGPNGSPTGGQVVPNAFAATVQGCAAAGQLTIAKTADVPAATPGSAVHYTVVVTNSGSAAYSGAAFTDPLNGVLDDAVYNGDASATAGTVSFSSPNLTWTGDLAVGAAATITYSVTIRGPDPGNGTLSNTVTSATAGSNCPAGNTDARCTATVNVSALTIAKSATTAATAPGGIVGYTITVTNSGQTAYANATFTDPMSGVLDDAAYNGDASATGGTVAFSSPNLTWTGSLAIGASATVTYSVTVASPDPGNHVLSNTVTSATAGSNCPAGSTDARCAAAVTVSGLAIVKTADVSTTTPGSTVHYTITVTNTGQAAVTGAAVTDPLTGVLDDASYDGDAAATAGSVSYTAPDLTWTGNLAVGAAATITYSVTVRGPDPGNGVLSNTVTSTTAGSNCPSGNADPRCAATVTVSSLRIVKTANVSATTPGATVGYTIVVTNNGPTAYPNAAFTDPLDGVLDDAAYNSDASATGGTVAFASPDLTWTGSLAAGASATVTYSVTVRDPDAGDKILANTLVSATPGSNCPAGGADPNCSAVVRDQIPALDIVASANTATTTPGAVVAYTITVTNTGQTAYTGATFTDPLADVLDDAAYGNDAAATGGTAGVAGQVLTWTGNLALGASATITFSVTVSSPGTGNAVLSSTITSASAGSSCPSGGTDPECTTTVTVARLAILNSANVATTTPGGIVRYTATFTNTGAVPFTGITVSTDASDVFDDAVPNGDQTATSGTLTLTTTGVSWTGSIPVGAAVTVTGTVTVKNPGTGNSTLTSTLTSAAPGSNCPPGGTDPRCAVTVTVLVPGLTITKTAGGTTFAVPGQAVRYTIIIHNTGQAPYTGITVTDSLAAMADDAVYNNDAAVTAGPGSVGYTSPDLTWSGDLAVGASVTITYSVTVRDPAAGDKLLIDTVTSAAAGSTCPPGTTAAACRVSIPVLTPALTISKTASTATALPGQTLTYTITVADTGQTPYSGAAMTDDLTGLLDEATYDADAAVTSGPGSVSYTEPGLTWTGDLAPGTSATITYTVTVHNPISGNGYLTNTVTSPTPGSNCAAGGTDPRCTVAVTVVSAATLTFTTTADAASTTAGSVVRYTVTVANSGLSQYSGASFTGNLAGVIDDAAYNNDATPGGGITWTSPILAWTGNVPAAGSVTISYTVTVDTPGTGDKILTSTLTSPSPGSNCGAGSADPRCSTTVGVASLAISVVTDVATTAPGGVVRYTFTFANTGAVPYTGITIRSDGTDIFDDAVPEGDQTATSGTVELNPPAGASWTGDIPVGGTVTVTGAVAVLNPDPGNKVLTGSTYTTAPGSNCPRPGLGAPCGTRVIVQVPALTIVKTADATSAVFGATIGYTITVTNSGQTPYTGATVTDSLAQMFDDASYDNNATLTGPGSVSYTSPDLTWTGGLAVGASVTITYSVTVNLADQNGDKIVINTVASADPGSTCPPGTTAAPCRVAVPVLTPALTIVKTASTPTSLPGATVTYTVTVTDTGQTGYPAAAFTDDLTGVLGDAAYDNDAAVTTGPGSVSYTSPQLTWTGNLAAGASATVTYSVTVHKPITGGGTLTDTVTSATPASNCPAGGADPRCTATVRVAQLTIVNSADVSATAPGGVVRYTFNVTNTGQVPLPDAAVTADFAGVFDDAVYNGDVAATAGTITINVAAHTATWTGDLAPGASVVITGSVTVKDTGTNDRILVETVTSATPGSNCPAGGTDPACTVTVTIVPGSLSITVPAAAGLGAAAPGTATSAGLGAVQVRDDRDLVGGSWTATVSATDFTTGGGTLAERIPAGDATYFINALDATSGSATFTPTPVTTLSSSSRTVVTASGASGDTTATWDPAVQVTVPAAAVAGVYAATITHSVS